MVLPPETSGPVTVLVPELLGIAPAVIDDVASSDEVHVTLLWNSAGQTFG